MNRNETFQLHSLEESVVGHCCSVLCIEVHLNCNWLDAPYHERLYRRVSVGIPTVIKMG